MKIILRNTRFPFCVTLAALLLCWSQPSVWGQGRNETIAKTGDVAPDGDGAFSSFYKSVINESGQVCFDALLSGTSNFDGIFRSAGGNVTQIARRGQVLPGGTAVAVQLRLAAQVQAPLNDFGIAIFRAELSDGPGLSTKSGFFRGDGSNVSQIVRSGQTNPSGDGVITLTNNSPNSFAGNNSDQSVFLSQSFQELYRENGGVIESLNLVGQPEPNGNGTFNFVRSIYFNDAGQLAFEASLTGNPDGASNGIFREFGGVITPIVYNGQAAPDGNGTYRIENGNGYKAFNNAGQFGFGVWLSGTSGGSTDNEGVFVGSGGSIVQIVREGDATPDGSGVFGSPNSAQGISGPHSINDSGQVVFTSVIRDTTDLIGTGIYRGDGNTITQIFHSGDSAPDGNGTLRSFGVGVVINDAGLVGMVDWIVGSSGGATDNKALLLGDGTDLIQVARKGDSIEGSTISEVFATGQGSLNSSGQITYRVKLEDGRFLVRRWTPELSWRATENGDWSDSNNWTLGLTPGEVHDVSIDSDSNVSISVPTNVNVNSLQIGGGNGLTTLNLQTGGSLTTTTGLNILSNGTLTGTGNVSTTVNNSGTVEAENLVFTSAITNSDTGTINIGSGANVSVDGDLVQNGSLNIPANATTVVQGTFSGYGGFSGWGRFFARGRLRIGNSPASVLMEGDLILEHTTESEFEFAGEGVGDFDQLVVARDLTLAGDLSVVELDGFSFGPGQEFIIADVSNVLTGQFTGLNEGDLVGNFGGTDLFISYTAGDGNDVSLYTEVDVPLLGDVNLDGAVNFFDISFFITLLSGGTFQAEADVDENGVVNFFDIAPFIELLSSL